MKNPCDKVEKPKKRKKQRGYLSEEEYDQILEYLDSIGEIRNAALISFMYSSGCRLTEVYQQNRSDLNFEARRFKVLGKGAKERTCIFNSDAVERIKAYLDTRTDDKDALFLSRQGNRLSKKSYSGYG
ncbi:MAG: tyrosine-type recombinase/integrase [Marinisporobacter sp.]|jgi:integrase/recombinase XerD|nr:tyrosine-type recombinase/integrase [Marinisporobacter sp.]